MNTKFLRRQIMNFTNKIYDVISNLIDVMIEKTIQPEDECKIGNKYYIQSYIPDILDYYYRDPDLERISALLNTITLDDIRCIRALLTNEDTAKAIHYLSKKLGYEEMSDEYYSIYKRSKTSAMDLLKEENTMLKEEIARLEAELEKYRSTNIKFTPDNITKESCVNARVVINKVQSGYKKEYTNISQLLTEEGLDLEPTIKGGFTGLPGVLKSRVKENSKFVFIVLDGYRIDFIFEN